MAIQSHSPVLLRGDPAPAFKSAPAISPVISSACDPLPASIDLDKPLPPFSAATADNTTYLGWNKNAVEVQQVPMYFPKGNLNLEFPQKHLNAVLEEVATFLRKASIQAKVRDSPLSAFLQTTENIEFYLVFFHERITRRQEASMDPVERKLFMSVQRHKGDQQIANKYFHAIIGAAKKATEDFVSSESDPCSLRGLYNHRCAPNAEVLLNIERTILRSCEMSDSFDASATEASETSGMEKQTPKDMIKSSVTQLYSWVQTPKRLDNRQHILEYLAVMTNVNRTMSSSAIAGALLVLQGSAPDMNNEAKEIQRFFLTILQHRALPGDRSMFDGMSTTTRDSDDDVEMRPYFPEESETAQGFPSFFVESMNKLFHLALQVLVQSLEVVACFHQQIVADGANIQDMAADFLFDASELAEGKELYTTLLECVSRAESKLANAYLACKAFRLLAMAYPSLKERLKLDDNARASIQNAYNVGKTCHDLLKDESFDLWETVRQ